MVLLAGCNINSSFSWTPLLIKAFFFLYKCYSRKWVVNKYQILKKQVQMASVQFSSVTQSRLTLCNPMDCSMPGFLVHSQLLELAQTHFHRVGDAIQQSHPLLSPSSPDFNLSQHHSLFQWVSYLHQVAKVLKFQLQHQSFQWIFRTDFL